MSTKPSRRIRFGLIVMISQIFLISMALAWAVHMGLIVIYRKVYFIENNPAILWFELIATLLISIFGVYVFIAQLRRLGEHRRNEDFTDRKV